MGQVTSETWTDQASCKGQVDVWFSTDAVLLNAARRDCAACPVLSECHALAHRIEPVAGVWAGELWSNGRTVTRRARKGSNDQRSPDSTPATAREGAR